MNSSAIVLQDITKRAFIAGSCGDFLQLPCLMFSTSFRDLDIVFFSLRRYQMMLVT